jgi:hypothetical protein
MYGVSTYESHPRHSGEHSERGSGLGPELPPPGFYERTLRHYKSVELALGIVAFMSLFVILAGVIFLFTYEP